MKTYLKTMDVMSEFISKCTKNGYDGDGGKP